VKYREVLLKKCKKSANSAKYKCRDDRRVVLMLNRNAVAVKKSCDPTPNPARGAGSKKKQTKNREIS
jgi:hypothetical protein